MSKFKQDVECRNEKCMHHFTATHWGHPCPKCGFENYNVKHDRPKEEEVV